jgi:hypothetical protein
MRTIRWLKQLPGGGVYRRPGSIEKNDDWLCEKWVEMGCAEFAEDDAQEAPTEKAIEASPVDRSMKKGKAK